MGSVTAEEATKIMKERGYNDVSRAGNGSWINFAKDIAGVWVNAKVFLAEAMMEMQIVTLKYGCELRVNKFDFWHKRFVEFEKWSYFYGAVCAAVDKDLTDLGFVKDTLKSVNENAFGNLFKDPPVIDAPPPKQTLKERVLAFKKKVIEIGKEKEHEPEMCKAFFAYWSEVSDGGKKMKWEIVKQKKGTFNIAGRLVTWRENDKVYNDRYLNRKEKEAKKQNDDIKVIHKAKTKDLF